MAKSWSSDAARYLTNWARCPRCDSGVLENGWCPNCGADVTGQAAVDLASASTEAAAAIERRQALIDALPLKPRASRPFAPVVTPVIASASGSVELVTATTAVNGEPSSGDSAVSSAALTERLYRPATDPTAPITASSSSQISVQSVLAVAGAGLVAIAALVFTFLNPDLSDVTLRTIIIGATTAIFLGGALLLARAGLQFSAEAVGALGMVFVALDVWALTLLFPDRASDWIFAGIGTVASSLVMMVIAARVRLRTWAWSGAVGLSISAAFFGYAGEGPWWAIAGHLGVGFVSLAVHLLLPVLEKRFGRPLRAERRALSALRITAAAIALIQLFVLFGVDGIERALGTATVLVALGALAALSARTMLSRFWSFLAGAFVVAAVATLPFALLLDSSEWLVALVPAAGSLGLAIVTILRTRLSGLDLAFVLGGGWTVTLAAVIPAIVVAVAQATIPVVHLQSVYGRGYRAGSIFTGSDFAETTGDWAVGPVAFISATTGLATILALAAVVAASLVLWRFAALSAPPVRVAVRDPRTGVAVLARSPLGLARSALLFAICGAGAVAVTLTTWSAIVRPAQAAIGLGIAVLASLALARISRLRRASARLRVPLVVTAHLLVLLVGVISWADGTITVVVGAAMVLSLGVVAQAVPDRVRPLHFGLGYAYALIMFATALDRAGVGAIAVLCLTTSLASAFALVLTLGSWLRPRFWYAALIVTIVPFLCAIAAVLAERSGWTALSTALTFGLALAVLVTRRSGLTSFLRIAAAALLVPSLAVIVVCLGAQFLVTSGSPATLPVIAVIVAAVLPSTGLVRSALVSRGLSASDALAARDWIEYSSFLTAGLAVVLAVVRPAAGFETSFLVLFILGLGSLATAFFSHRRYAWWTAAASFTGALWSVWAIVGVDVLEPYLLPPAISAVIVGAALTARGRPAIGLFASGLGTATLPTLVILAFSEGGSGDIAWRAYGLLAGATLLVVIGAWITRISPTGRLKGIRDLQLPILVVAITSTASAAVQAIRYGLGLDPLDLVDSQLVMVIVLAFSLGGLVLSGLAAGLLLDRARAGSPDVATFVPSRWLFAAPLVYLTVGPIAAIRPGVFPIATLWVLMAVLLAVMVVTVIRARNRAVALPPVWFVFALAWGAAVAGWSERELRVEFFSLPLGLALLGTGVIALRRAASSRVQSVRPGWTSWPLGFDGSWRLLTPGILVIFVTSVLSTGTDPQTWRAILVIGLALIAIFVGSVLKLAAPFILGIVVLPIENLVVFIVQIGESIGAGPWWITLSTAGAVLLVLAVTSERRTTGDRGVTSRLRDLR